MNLLNLVWFFFILAGLQPVLRQYMLESARRRMLGQVERARGSRVIVLIHRQESMSFLGFPVMRYIDVNDSEEVIRAIHLTAPDVPLDIVLHTPGGLVLAALQIARAVRRHPAKTTVHVPHYAMSGGTLIALAADEIIMDEHAVLGPLDPQVGGYPAASLLKVVEEKPVGRVDDQTLILADVAAKATAQTRHGVLELLEGRMEREQAESIAAKLTSGSWTHDHPISCREAIDLGLPVKCGLPAAIYRMMGLYPQPARRTKSVEYLPLPRAAERRPLPAAAADDGASEW
ncbi:MAG: SDH family Clp fold serine proteinase [Patescibacteria group bacterium]